jgi:capsular polysaccharide biosynthesis protein/MinD-like ATPase involved in chromosome partitioning or flagellar assembly
MSDYESLPRSFQRYAMVLRRQWWVVTVVTVVAILAAVVYVKQAQPVYAASSNLVVGQGETLFAPGVSVDIPTFTQTISDLLQSNVVARDTISALGLNTTPSSLLGNLTVSSTQTTAVISVTYNDTDPQRAVKVLSTLGSIFTGLVNTKLAGKPTTAAKVQGSQPVSAVVFDPAHLNPGHVSPKTGSTLAIAAVLGLVAGLLLAFLRDALSSTIKNEGEAEAAYGGPVIGALPKGALGLAVSQLAELPQKPRVRIDEAFHMLSARLRYSTGLQRGVIVVTGARPEDGKSTVAAHLAAQLASAGSDVVAVEGDLHRPALHRLFGLEPRLVGIRDIAAAGGALSTALVPVQINREILASTQTKRPVAVTSRWANGDAEELTSTDPRETEVGLEHATGRLRMLPAGTAVENPANALSLGNSASLVSRLRALADYAVIDTPPLLLAGDAYPLIQLADAVVVVCREGATRQHEAHRAREILRSLGVHEISIVLSDSSSVERDYYSYGGY